jgi:hypothetical protein
MFPFHTSTCYGLNGSAHFLCWTLSPSVMVGPSGRFLAHRSTTLTNALKPLWQRWVHECGSGFLKKGQVWPAQILSCPLFDLLHAVRMAQQEGPANQCLGLELSRLQNCEPIHFCSLNSPAAQNRLRQSLRTRCGVHTCIPVLRRLRQEDHEFEGSLRYTVRPRSRDN